MTHIPREAYFDVVSELVRVFSAEKYRNVLIAVYLGGSVARGDFIPGRSDIDIYIVTSFNDEQIQNELNRDAAGLVSDKLESLLHIHEQPITLAFTTLDAVSKGESFLGTACEYWNFINTGALLYGKDIKDRIPVPTRSDERSFAEEILNGMLVPLKGFPDVPPTDKSCSQLFNMVFASTRIALCGMGKYVSSKSDIVHSLEREYGDDLYKKLARIYDYHFIWGQRSLSKEEFDDVIKLCTQYLPELLIEFNKSVSIT